MSHPRAYGSFARVLGKYSRDEKRLSLAEAVRRMSALPAANLALRERGSLKPGYYADVVVFDPKTIADRATVENPWALATGVRDVFVNGTAALRAGEATKARPGQVVRPRLDRLARRRGMQARQLGRRRCGPSAATPPQTPPLAHRASPCRRSPCASA